MPDVDLTRTTDLLQLHQVDGQEFGEKLCVQVGVAPQEVTPGREKDNISEIQHLIDETTVCTFERKVFQQEVCGPNEGRWIVGPMIFDINCKFCFVLCVFQDHKDPFPGHGLTLCGG